MNFKLSIVVPCYNEEKRILPLLESLEAQTVKPEAIFVDGGSTDKTVSMVKSFATLNRNIKLLKETGKRSAANARNVGIRAATGNLLVILNADTILEKNYTQKIIDGFEHNQDADMINFQIEPYIPSNVSNFQKASYFRDEGTVIVNSSMPHSVMKTSLQRRIGYYDPELGFGEDRYMSTHGFSRASFKTVDLKDKVKFARVSYPSVKGFFSRCLWYGRTIPIYLRKEMSLKILIFYMLSIATIPLFFVFWANVIFTFALAACLAVPFTLGCYKSVRVMFTKYRSVALILVPFLEILQSIGIGLGFFQYISGNRTLGR